MKKIALALAVFCSIIIVSSVNVNAGAVKEGSLFFAGMCAGLAGHEGGHWLTAKMYGEKAELGLLNGQIPCVWTTGEGTALQNIALGGFAAEIATSEALLYTKAPKDNSFVIGWLTWNILEPLTYILRHEVIYHGKGYGDLQLIDDHDQNRSLKVEHVEIAISAHALFTAYRLWKNEEFQQSPIRSYLKCSKDKIEGGLTWDF